MRISRIGVDIDGVLADFNTAYINLCIEVAGKDLFPPRPFDIPCWNYPEHYGYSEEEVSAVWNRIKQDQTFWYSLKAYPETRETLGLLSVLELAGNDIYFVTSRPGIYAKNQTEAWLNVHGFDRAAVLISNKKGLCARALTLDFYIDDRWENCVDVAGSTVDGDWKQSNTGVFMVDRPWNRAHNPDVAGITVVGSALDFARAIADLHLLEPA